MMLLLGPNYGPGLKKGLLSKYMLHSIRNILACTFFFNSVHMYVNTGVVEYNNASDLGQ